MKSIENKTSLIIDLFFCIVFMPILVFLGPAYYWIEVCPEFVVIACAYLYACYFAVKKLNIPKLLIGRDYTKIMIIVASTVVCTWLLTLYPLPKLDFLTPTLSEYQTGVRDYGIYVSLWLMFSLVMGYALTTSFVMELYAQLLQKRKIEAERDKAELAVFKAQISPHFLFNTLNSLYSLVIGTSQKAEDAFIKFTDILKYTYVTIGNEFVTLRDEIEYIGNYIDLQAIRLNGHTKIEWEHETDNDEVLIPPMLMLTFVENAFKYGASTSRDCRICISLRAVDGHLEFDTSNSIMKHADEFRTEMPVGIENCRARLNGIFPGKHILETTEHDGVFRLHLEIELGRQTGK